MISLARIAQLDLLRLVYGRLHIPSSVRNEVVACGLERLGAREIASADWIHTLRITYYSHVPPHLARKRRPILFPGVEMGDFWQDKRVLVTGGAGFLGRCVVQGLRRRW
ncbi:MAG: hypothetical protein JW850_02100 [Thermoflexales bacterium]|nr:hypothetical protein [Thermoflexales bacterium]